MSKDNSEPAFPSDSNQYGAVLGMSLRDYLASKALQGLCSDPSTEGAPVMEMAAHCYGIADAMLAVRSA